MHKDIAFGIIISLLFISLVVLFCMILIKLYIQKIKKHNQQLFENEINFQKTLNTSILETQEQLLTRVSQDLHDDAGQQLTVINFQLENLKIDFPKTANNIMPISESVSKLSQSLRQISHSLNPNWLENNGIINAISIEINRLKKNKNMTVLLNLDSAETNFKKNEQIVLYRIFQESINNILKHANATRIEVNIFTQPKFKLEINDNGIGFDVAQKTNSIGLQNCKNRAAIINYTFTVDSQINYGTKVTLKQK